MSCATLKYLVDNTDHGCMNITISNSQNISGVIAFINSSDLSIIGTGLVNIICDVQGGMLFENTQRIHLENLKFINCAMNYSYSNVDMYPYIDHAAVYFYGGNDIEITGCVFTHGLGTGVIIYDVIGNNYLSYTNFTANRPAPNTSYDDISVNSTFGGLIIRRQHVPGESTYIIYSCIFKENMNVISSGDNGLGGGISLHLSTADDSSIFVSILDSHFELNDAIKGGGMHINASGGNSSSYVISVSNSTFQHNHVDFEGGGILVQLNDGPSCTLYLNDSLFLSNSGMWGGGLAAYNGNNLNIGLIRIIATNSNWTANNARTSGMGASFNYYATEQTEYTVVVKFVGCWFGYNTNKGIYYTDVNSVGAVYAAGSKVDFDQCEFTSNYGSALFIRYFAYITFTGNTNFSHNYGTYGAAIYIAYTSVVVLKNNVTLTFHGNVAIIEGGAIYTDIYKAPGNKYCVFEPLKSHIQSNDSFTVVFSDNLAGNRTHSIFVGDPSSCCYTECNGSSDDNLLMNSKIFHYQPDINSQVTSIASSISLESKPPRNANNQLEVMLGEKFYILPKVTDVFGNSAHITGRLVLIANYKQSFMPTQNFNLIGPSTICMDNFTKNNELYIIGNKDEIHCANLSLQFVYQRVKHGYRDESVELNIKLVKCKNGYLYNEISQQCECYPSDNFICPTRNNSYACIRYGYWYGIDDKNGNTLLSCPGQNCHYTDGNCPQSSECPDSPDFCLLGKSNDLCRKGRGGTLCSECRENHSFTFGALKCVPSTSCKAGNTALILVGIFIYWMFSIFLVLIILSLDLSVGSGFMYGIVYYFSVVFLFLENSVTDPILQTAINTCVAITQLCPRVFGNIDVCFAESWMNLHHLMFHYATPVFVVSAIFTIICLSRYCRCPKSLSLAQNSPIHAISILVLFSYTSLAYTSFQILKPITINGDVKVYVDPKFSYFHKQHIPYAIVAILCECLISLPTCLLLLLAPCLSRRLDFVKLRLKPIVDDFQACYHPNHRWFAGFYFLARQLMYLAYVIPHQWLPQSFSPLHIVNALILIVHSVFQPYKQKWLNILDTILLIDLFLLSFFKLDLKSTSDIARKAIPYLLIMFPILYLFSIIAVLLFKRFKSFWFWLNCRKIPAKPFSTFTATTVGINSKDESVSKTSSNITFADSFYKDDGEREPLLSDMNCGQSPYSKANTLRWNPGFTTSSLRVSSMKRFPPHADKASTN